MVDPATSMMHVIDELRDTVEELGEELARDMAPPELNKRATEDGVKSLAYAAKRVMSQVHVTVKNVQVRPWRQRRCISDDYFLTHTLSLSSLLFSSPTPQIRVIFPRPGESQCTCFCFQLGQAELRDATADAAVADDPASPAARQPVPRADSLDVTSSPHSVKHVQLSDYGLYVETGQTSAGDDNHSLTIVERIPLVQFLSPATKPDFVSITLQHVFLPTTPKVGKGKFWRPRIFHRSVLPNFFKVDVEAFLHGMYVAVSPALLVELTQFVSLLTGAIATSMRQFL